MFRYHVVFCFLVAFSVIAGSYCLQAEPKPLVEKQGSQQILRLKGSPYYMGFTHGKALKDAVALNVKRFIGCITGMNAKKIALGEYE